MSVDVTVNRTWARITQEKKIKEVACIFHTKCTPHSSHLLGSPGSPFHSWASWFTCTRKAVLRALKNKPIILKLHVMREGKKNPNQHCPLNSPHPGAHPNSGSGNEGKDAGWNPKPGSLSWMKAAGNETVSQPPRKQRQPEQSLCVCCEENKLEQQASDNEKIKYAYNRE